MLSSNNNRNKRRFYAFADYCINTFGERLQKVAVDAGFTCPNRDGSIGTGGCTYCNNESFNPSYCNPSKPVSTQISEGIAFLNVRYKKAERYLVYFQAYTNTYKSIEVLKRLYEEALAYPGVAGLIIGTRPDCVSDALLSYLSRLSEKHFILVEFGMESSNDATLRLVNRGHTFAQTQDALHRCAQYNIKAGVHLIFGLPGETQAEMVLQASMLNTLPIHSVKIHQLQVVKGTALEKLFTENPELFMRFTFEQYIDLVIDFTELLHPDIVIDRFAGEVPPRYLAGPSILADDRYGFLRYDQVLQRIEKRMAERDTWQGKLI